MNQNVPTVPYSNNNNFIFTKNIRFNSIDIFFEHVFINNLDNYFLIIKSYLNNNENIILYIQIIGSDPSDKNLPIFHNINMKKLKNISYLDFREWYDDLYDYDLENYLKNYKYYGIRFIFDKNCENWKKSKIYPEFPWKLEFKKIFIKKIGYLQKIEKLEKDNKYLKSVLRKYRKIIKL